VVVIITYLRMPVILDPIISISIFDT
jgi:hypothetical protein